MNRKLLIGGGVVAALLASAVIVPSFIDWNKYKPQIVNQLSAATGHVYDIHGPLQLAILPTPHMNVSGLTVSAPPEQGGEAILTLDHASGSVALLPLLSGKVVISRVTLDKPVFTAAIAKDGTPSWMTPKLKAEQTKPEGRAPSKPASSADNIVVQSVRIKDGAVRFQDARSGADYAINGIDLDVKGDSLFGPYAVDGSLVYKDEKIDFEGKSGRIENGVNALPLQIKAEIDSSDTEIEFKGVAGIKPPIEIQGETVLKTGNLTAALKPFVKSPPEGMAKPAELRGLLTYGPDSVAFRNASFKYADADLIGSLVVSGMKEGPLNVTADLSSDKPVNLDAMLPGGKADSRKPSETKAPAAKPAGLLSATITLPKSINGKITLGLKSVTYKNIPLNDFGLALTLAPKAFEGSLKSTLTGNGSLAGSFVMNFASATRGADGSVTLSDPALNYRVQASTSDPRKVLAAFLPSDKLKDAGNILSSTLALDTKGVVTPRAIRADAGALTLLDTSFAFSGSYTPQANKGRDMIVLTASTERLDADAWLKRLSPDVGQEAAVQQPGKKADVASAAKSVSLPFDLDLGATVGALRYHQNDYGNVNVKASLIGDRLNINNAGFQDQAGNVLTVAGSLENVRDLRGIDLRMSGKTPDADLLLKTLKVDASGLPANVGPAEGVAEFKGQADKLSFTANLKALKGSLEAQGALSDLLQTPKVSDLTFRLRHPNYVELARLWSPSFRGSVDIPKNLDFFTSMQREGEVYTFKQVKATVGPSTMNGEIRADMGGTIPSITASMQFDNLPLDKLLGGEATDRGGSSGGRSSSSSQGGEARWSRDAINTEWMRKWNADVKTTAGQASYGNWNVNNAALDFVLKDSILTLSKMEGGMYGGRIHMTGKMSSTAQARDPVSVSADIGINDVSLESFVQSFAGARLIQARGMVSVDANVASSGLSPAALIFDLGGKGTMKGNNIVFQGFDLAKLSRTLAQPSSSMKENFSGLLGATVSGGSTQFDTLDGAFTINEGVINFDKMQLAGKDATVDTAGAVNLPLWTVNLESTITLPEPKDNPPPPLKVAFKGPLDNPAQTFGKGALESYFMQQYGNRLQEQLVDKLGKKLDKKGGALGEVGKTILPGLLGVPAQQPAAQAPSAPATPQAAPAQQQTEPAPAETQPQAVEPAASDPAPEPAQPSTDPARQQAAPAQQPQDNEVKPEDVFNNLIQNMVQPPQQ